MLIFTEKVAITYNLLESQVQNVIYFISIYAKTYFTLGDCKKISNWSDYKISKHNFFFWITNKKYSESFIFEKKPLNKKRRQYFSKDRNSFKNGGKWRWNIVLKSGFT